MRVDSEGRGAVLDEAVLKCLKFKKNIIFGNNYRLTGGCKETEREVPCTFPSSPRMLAFYEIIVQYQNQESDISANP